MNDDFYVGYLPQAPTGLASAVRRRVLAVLVLALGAGAALTLGQSDPGHGTFEFGVERTFRGRLMLEPAPHLLVERPGTTSASTYLLTVFGKRSAGPALAPFGGRLVELSGQLVHRGAATMIEVDPTSVVAEEEDLTPPYTTTSLRPSLPREAGPVTLRGEIVDAKCYWGVMKPGHTKPHRGCAARCIASGVPAVLLVREADGTARTLLLVDEDGATVNDRIGDLVAEPVEISGVLVRQGDLEILRADPAGYRRIDS